MLMRDLERYRWIVSAGIIDVKKRVIIVLIFTFTLYSLLYIASTIPLSSEEADLLMKEAEEIFKQRFTIIDIFLNNFLISLIMLIPVAGPIVGGYIIFTTGRLLGALSVSTGFPPILLISLTIITIYGLIEFLAYGTAFTESILFTYSIFKKKTRIESRWLIISIAGTAILLLAAAALEYTLIQFFGQVYPGVEEFAARI